VRLDHLLSKESTARVRSSLGSELGELLRRAPAIRSVDHPDPTWPPGIRGTTGDGGSGHHCSVLREHAKRLPGQRDTETRCRRPRPVPVATSAARGLTRWLRTAERARASRTKKLPSYKEPTVDALAPDADEGRGWLRKATGSCRPSAMTRGYPNGETRLGSCPVTPARTHRAGGGHRGN
jgi:hypothetical protein